MPIDPTTLNTFREHAAAIVAANPTFQPAMTHDTDRWRQGLCQSEEAIQSLNVIIEFLKGKLSITRQSLFDAITEQLPPQARFLMQMIWGYTPTDGRAPTRVLKYFQSPLIQNRELLREIFAQIANLQLREAYCQLCEVNGLSTSYITKTLYFESRSLPNAAGTYAVIMDDRVSSGMVKLLSPWASDCVMVTTPRPSISANLGPRAMQNRRNNAWQDYWAYVSGCHEVATALKTEADHIEYFLFNYEG